MLPRLEQQGWTCIARRREDFKDHPHGYTGAIEALLAEPAQGQQLVLLDQVEELWTDPLEQENTDDFFQNIQELITLMPQVKLILSFRKEHLSEIRLGLKKKVNYREYPIVSMDEKGIRRAFREERVQEQFPQYQALDPELEKQLAEDVRQDEQSNIAPLLQYQLQSLWEKASTKDSTNISLRKDLYEPAASLSSFLNQQKLPLVEAEFPEAARSGLLNDLLYFYTSTKETAVAKPDGDLWKRYSHLAQAKVMQLRDALVDQYLLIRNDTGTHTRLAHDTLAPMVRKRYEDSDAPGQLARPIILAKNKLLQQGQEPKFSATDIENIHAGINGMPVIPDRLAKIIEKEEERLDKEQRQRFDLFSNQTDRLLEEFALEEASQSWQLAVIEELDRPQTFARGCALFQAWVEVGKAGETAQHVYHQLRKLDSNIPEDMILSGPHGKTPLAFLKSNGKHEELLSRLKKRYYPTMLPIELIL